MNGKGGVCLSCGYLVQKEGCIYCREQEENKKSVREQVKEIITRHGINTSEDMIYWNLDSDLDDCVAEILSLFPAGKGVKYD